MSLSTRLRACPRASRIALRHTQYFITCRTLMSQAWAPSANQPISGLGCRRFKFSQTWAGHLPLSRNTTIYRRNFSVSQRSSATHRSQRSQRPSWNSGPSRNGYFFEPARDTFNRIPTNAVFWTIVGANGAVFLMWQSAVGHYVNGFCRSTIRFSHFELGFSAQRARRLLDSIYDG